MNSLLLALILIVVIAMAIAQFGFFFWLLRKVKRNNPPLSPEQYKFLSQLFAAALFSISAAFATYSAALIATGTKTTGVVVELRPKREENGDQLFAPTFSFVDEAGVTNTIDSNLYSSSTRYRVGNRVPIVYRRANPASARINDFLENWFASIMFAAFGLLALLTIPIYRKWRCLRAIPTESRISTAERISG